MQKVDRLSYIFDTLRREGSVSVKHLKEVLGVSESTIRRDIQAFLRMTKLPVKRVHGGLVLGVDKGSIEPVFEAKLSLMTREKARIATKALEYIEDGDSILLDSGTTALYLARLLHKRRGLKVIVADVKLAEELASFPEIETHIIAGLVRPGYYSIGGPMAEWHISQFTVEKAFLTADAVDPEMGVTNSSMFEVGVKRAIVAAGKTVILLADHSKLGKRALVKVCDLSAVDVFITSEGGDPEVLKAIAQKVPQLVEV
ncbi:DeoR/GlpR transcriptional regulator [Candidatus Bipolaricaulota bacterium]|nr:DeoR/GlpR transcriptional regulator [Candidatus Bipolaricaulota bacterium]